MEKYQKDKKGSFKGDPISKFGTILTLQSHENIEPTK